MHTSGVFNIVLWRSRSKGREDGQRVHSFLKVQRGHGEELRLGTLDWSYEKDIGEGAALVAVEDPGWEGTMQRG